MRLLFDVFEERLRQSDCHLLVAAGYSFADEDVRDRVLKAMHENENLELLLICGSSSKDIERNLLSHAPDLVQRIRAENKYFEVALGDGSIRVSKSERQTQLASCKRILGKSQLISSGQFRCVRMVHGSDDSHLILTDSYPAGTTRLLRLNLQDRKITVISSWVGEGSKFIIKGNLCTIAETKLHDFQFGIGSVWQIDLLTGVRTHFSLIRLPIKTPWKG